MDPEEDYDGVQLYECVVEYVGAGMHGTGGEKVVNGATIQT